MPLAYYDHFGFIYEPLWGENIHWGLFPHGDESLSDATEMYGRSGRVAFSAQSRGDAIVDVGTGPGFTARRLIEFFDVYVVGVDTSSFQLEQQNARPPPR